MAASKWQTKCPFRQLSYKKSLFLFIDGYVRICRNCGWKRQDDSGNDLDHHPPLCHPGHLSGGYNFWPTEIFSRILHGVIKCCASENKKNKCPVMVCSWIFFTPQKPRLKKGCCSGVRERLLLTRMSTFRTSTSGLNQTHLYLTDAYS